MNHPNLLIPNPKHLLTQFPFLATPLIQALYHLLLGLGSRFLTGLSSSNLGLFNLRVIFLKHKSDHISPCLKIFL